jgi:hypothetical protein
MIELASDGREYRGFRPCVSRADLAQHVEGRRKLVFERRKHELTRLLFLDGGAINQHFSF